MEGLPLDGRDYGKSWTCTALGLFNLFIVALVGGYVILVGLQELVDDGLRMLKGTFQEHCSKQVTLSTVYFVTQSTWETRRFLPLPHFTAISLVR